METSRANDGYVLPRDRFLHFVCVESVFVGQTVIRGYPVYDNDSSVLPLVWNIGAASVPRLLLRVPQGAVQSPGENQSDSATGSNTSVVHASLHHDNVRGDIALRSCVYRTFLYTDGHMGEPVLLPVRFLISRLHHTVRLLFGDIHRDDILPITKRRLSLVVEIVFHVRGLRYIRV